MLTWRSLCTNQVLSTLLVRPHHCPAEVILDPRYPVLPMRKLRHREGKGLLSSHGPLGHCRVSPVGGLRPLCSCAALGPCLDASRVPQAAGGAAARVMRALEVPVSRDLPVLLLLDACKSFAGRAGQSGSRPPRAARFSR